MGVKSSWAYASRSRSKLGRGRNAAPKRVVGPQRVGRPGPGFGNLGCNTQHLLGGHLTRKPVLQDPVMVIKILKYLENIANRVIGGDGDWGRLALQIRHDTVPSDSVLIDHREARH
jgi:hypothetical protein